MSEVKKAAGVLAAFTALLAALSLLLKVMDKSQASAIDKLK